MLRLVEECRPGVVFIENVDGAAWRKWLPYVRRDLWDIGYSSLSLRVRAFDVGAPFEGSRIFVAATDCYGKPTFSLNAEMALVPPSSGLGWVDWGKPPADALGVADGVPFGVDRRRAMGNAWVPAQAQEAFRRLMLPIDSAIPHQRRHC
jgi:DNA (cytosine-5)-methyltransferase 1